MQEAIEPTQPGGINSIQEQNSWNKERSSGELSGFRDRLLGNLATRQVEEMDLGVDLVA